MNQELIIGILSLIFVPFAFVALVVPFIKKLAQHVGALDMPNPRKVHHVPIPRLGGLDICYLVSRIP